MRGRMGLCVALMAALLLGAGGCNKKTPQQKAQEKAQKQAVAQAKAQRSAQEKQAKAQAKAEKQRLEAERDRAEAQAKAQHKQAEAQAKADKKRQVDERDRAEAQARAQKKQAEAQAKADQKRVADERDRAEAQARAAKKQADAQARADQEKAAAQARAEQEKAADQTRVEREKAAAEARLQSENAAAAARAEQERARAEAMSQKQQAALAKADAKNAKKNKSKKKPKKEKPVKYEDDEAWVVGDPYIHPENHERLLDRHVQAMAASGAVDDASLYDQHFDGGELNALGRSKIALMLQAARQNEPVAIYVAPAASDEGAQARLGAVDKFWKASQWSHVQVQAKQGLNPDNSTLAAIGIAGLRKMEKEQASGGQGTGGINVNPGASGATGGSGQ